MQPFSTTSSRWRCHISEQMVKNHRIHFFHCCTKCDTFTIKTHIDQWRCYGKNGVFFAAVLYFLINRKIFFHHWCNLNINCWEWILGCIGGEKNAKKQSLVALGAHDEKNWLGTGLRGLIFSRICDMSKYVATTQDTHEIYLHIYYT